MLYFNLPGCRSHPGHRLAGAANRARLFYWGQKIPKREESQEETLGLRGKGGRSRREKISFQPIWFDSLGAKSTCTRVETPDLSILIDPGVAAMQASFPASKEEKRQWKAQGRKAIEEASDVDIIVISHYHHDHYIWEDVNFYRGKTIYAKDPNRFINRSQRQRAEKFYQEICNRFGELKLDEVLREAQGRQYPDPLDELPLARGKDFGDYQERREELLRKGRKRFHRMAAEWNRYRVIPELSFEGCRVFWADSREFRFGGTAIKFSRPLFHGIEYTGLGWVIATVVTCGGEKLIHSSDLNGIYIEDYARWLIEEDPDVLILDGPPTYLRGYLLSEINLRRCIDNICRVIEEASTELIILDHHLCREPRFKEKLARVYETARGEGKAVTTAAEYLGKVPKVFEAEGYGGLDV